uniref:Dihydropteridine reductase n=1 Tax=Triatoma infestans TaxID=30076 RepID=A0A161MS41_TRIIF
MSEGRVLIYGGRGALGATCVSFFKNKQWWVGSIDLKENEQADLNVIVKPELGWLEQERVVLKDIGDSLNETKVDAVICVAGGWAGGNAASADFIKNADLMWKQSVWSSTIAASVGVKYLKEGGLITLPGANPALESTPGMIGYGLAKAAVHQLTKSLAAEKSGLPKNCHAFAILPVTLDTPMNRKWMPKADTSTWTPLEFIADLFYHWSKGEDRPKNGSLVSLITKDNKTSLVLA